MRVGGALHGVRGWVRAIGAVGAVLCASVVLLASPASAAAVTAAAPGDTSWTLAEGKAAVTSGVISRVAGAPAVVDTAAVRHAIRGTTIRVVMLPFEPLETDARHAAGARAVDLKDWARDEKGYELIEVEGLQVGFGIYDLVPDSMAELQPVLAQMDVTHQVLSAVAHLRKTADPPDPGTPLARPADPEQVDTIAAALAEHGLYHDPSLSTPEQPGDSWGAAGVTVRAAFLPPAPRGAVLPDLITPLHQRFPDDLVVVMRGRWMQAAGPQQDLVHSSLLWVYGYFSRAVLGWQVRPDALVGPLTERIGLLRTGVVADQPTPSEPDDPVSSVSRALPWVFAGVALAIVAVVTAARVLGGRGRRAQLLAAHQQATRERRTLGVRLAVLAGQVADLEPLVHGDAAGKEFSRAVERYLVAGDTLESGGSITVARSAIGEAERHLRSVANHVGVPLARPVEDDPPGSGAVDADATTGGSAR